MTFCPSFPRSSSMDLDLELRGSQLAAYEDLWQSRARLLRNPKRQPSDSNLLSLITRLKQLCNVDPASGESVKLEALKVILENLSLPTDKALVFSQYVQTLRWLSDQLDDMPYKLFHGGMREQERDETIRWFRESPGPCVLLISLKAGGVGLNLQEASTVVMFDRWWNPAVEDQAMQRCASVRTLPSPPCLPLPCRWHNRRAHRCAATGEKNPLQGIRGRRRERRGSRTLKHRPMADSRLSPRSCRVPDRMFGVRLSRRNQEGNLSWQKVIAATTRSRRPPPRARKPRRSRLTVSFPSGTS